MNPFKILLFLAAAASLSPSHAQVVINEIGASSNDRILRSHADGRFRLGAAGPSWMEWGFDDSAWAQGTAPFGFGNADLGTDVGDAMIGRTPSLYLRKNFTVSAANAVKEEVFRLAAAVDGGFIAYVNGFEIARGNMGRLNGFAFHDQSAYSNADKNKRVTYNATVFANEVLHEGENVFAVQVHNTVPEQIFERDRFNDTTLKFDATLSIGLGIFAGGSNIAIDLPDTDWKYRVGYAEPSGGVVDWAQAQTFGEGSFSDWIELRNTTDASIDLSGWHLTDSSDNPKKWTFPAGTTIPPQDYLLVLADNETETPGDYLHCNFQLSGSGEFLGLTDQEGQFISQFENGYPNQETNRSFGQNAAGEYVYFEIPTPGKANSGPEQSNDVKKPRFEPDGGFYEQTTIVTLSSSTEGARIRYTTDGSEPTEFNGNDYSGPITVEPINIRTGTPIRARAFKDGMIPSKESTQTYFVGLDDAFQTIPSISLVADKAYAFYAPHGVMTVEGGSGVGTEWVSRNVDDYYIPDMHGRPFERQVSMEIIYPEDGTNVQVDGGMRLAASAWSRGRFTLRRTDASPWPSDPAEKPSFNFFFRDDYGKPSLDFPLIENYPVRSFEQLRMRAGKNDINNPWIRDELARRVMMDTGQFGTKGILNALFVNGVYKGYFNTVARLREELFQAYYGSKEPWDVQHIDDFADGDRAEMDRLRDLLKKDMSVAENYAELLTVVDPVNMADYFLVNIYGATWDWPHNNFVVARERSEFGRWRAYMWDAEGTFGNGTDRQVTYNAITADLKPGRGKTPDDILATLFIALIQSPEFRLTFADRIQKHVFTEGGALTKDRMTQHLDELVAEIEPLMRFTGNGAPNVTPIRNWISGRENGLFKTTKQFEPDHLWGDVQVPVFNPKPGAIGANETLRITVGSLFNAQPGTIYYTTDGSDPRLPGGTPSPNAQAYTEPFPIDSSMQVKARVHATTLFDPAGKWSALQEGSFLVGLEPATADNLIVSEIMFDPAGATDEEKAAGFSKAGFEFIEFYNTSESSLDLSGLRFSQGIDYVFADGDSTTIPPQSYAVIVNDPLAFTARYGEGIRILGSFGKKLSNSGETLEVSTLNYTPLLTVTYNTSEPWPQRAAGEGYSLVLTNLTPGSDTSQPSVWASSTALGGSPGRSEDDSPSTPDKDYDTWISTFFTVDEVADDLLSGPLADPDHDGANNLTEFAFGSSPNNASSLSQPAIVRDGDEFTLTLSQRQSGIDFVLEGSFDLLTWTALPENTLQQTGSEDLGNGIHRRTWRSTNAESLNARYLRWKISR